MAFNFATAAPETPEATPSPAAVPAGTTPKFNFATAKPVGDGLPPKEPGLWEKAKAVADPWLAVPELGATALTGMASDTIGNVAGLGAMGVDAVGTLFGRKPGETADPAAVKEAITSRGTYMPQTQTAKDILGLAAKPFQYIDEKKAETADIARQAGGDVAGNLTQAGLNGAEAILEYLPGVKGARALHAAGELPEISGAERAAHLAREAPVAQASKPEEVARSLGLKLRPSDIASNNPGQKQPLGGRIAEALTDSQQIGRDFSIENQGKITQAAAKDIGLPDGTTKLDTAQLDTLRKPHEAVYGEVAKLPQTITSPEYNTALKGLKGERGADPAVKDAITALQGEFAVPGAPKDMLASIKALRSRAKKQIQSDDVKANEVGYANKRMAGLLEDELERVAVASGNTELLTQFRSARRDLAKINTVDDALKAGQVDAATLKKARDKGAPLDGRLAAIADAAEFHPHVTKHPHSFNGASATDKPTTVGGAVQKVVSKLGPEKYLNNTFQKGVFEGGDEALGKYFEQSEPKPLPEGAGAPNPFGGPEGEQAADLRARAASASDRDLASELTGTPRQPGEPIEWDQQRGGSAPLQRQVAQGANPDPGFEYTDRQLEVPQESPVGPPVSDDMALSRELGLSAPDALGVAGKAPQTLDDLLATVFGPAEGPKLPDDLGPFHPAAPDFDTGGLSLADDVAPPRAQSDFLDEPLKHGLAVLPQGQKRAVSLYRGVGEGRDPASREGTLGGAMFYTPDEATARTYAGTGGQVANPTINFNNLLDADTLAQLRDYLGLDPRSELTDIIAAARQNKYDGVTYDLQPGREYVDLRE